MAVLSFSSFIFHLFAQTIPSVVISFFREASGAVILGAVLVFAFAWFLKARPQNRPKEYSIITYDINGQEFQMDGIKTRFRTHDVAWSFMKQYKEIYPHFNFALVSKLPNSQKPTIFRYI